MENKTLTSYPSIDKPWLKYYTEEAINAPLPECTIYEYLYEQNKDHLGDIALNYFDRKITYGQLFDNIEKTAKAFSALGVKEGDIVTISSVTTPEIIYAFYALNRLGAVSNMVDPRTSTEGIKHYIEEVESKIVISIDVALPKIEKAVIGTKVEKIISVSPYDSLPTLKRVIVNTLGKLKGSMPQIPDNCITWNDFAKLFATPKYIPYKKDTCCVIVHTGGTTGMPKGVMLSNDNLNAVSKQLKYSNAVINRQDSFLNIIPPFVAYGIALSLHSSLTLGWITIVVPKFDPEEFEQLLDKYRPNNIMGIPTYWNPILASKSMQNKDLSFIKNILLGGDRTPVEFEERLNEFLKTHGSKTITAKGYSMTEASACATFATKGSNKAGSVGIPLYKTIISIFDTESGDELPYNTEGEICFNSPTVMLGYYENDIDTQNVLKMHNDETMWLHSGDIGYMDEDGFIYVLDRIKRVIIRPDGFKVFPKQIENAVMKHNTVSECCSIGVVDKTATQGKLPIVFAVLKDNADIEQTKAQLFEQCKAELPEYAQPIDFIFIDKLPLTPIGKVDYRKLEAMAKQNL